MDRFTTREHAHIDAVVAAAQSGDQGAFAQLVARHRRELHVHCQRMLGSTADAEDLVQETFLRAWSKRSTFQGRSTFRAWLYRIATNACLDALARQPARVVDGDAVPAVAEIVAEGDEPHVVVVAKETIELAFRAAIQHLPPKQRAALILRDVLDLPASDTAAALETSVPAVKSALQRARGTLQARLPAERLDWPRA